MKLQDGLFAVFVVGYGLIGGFSLVNHFAVLPVVMLLAFWPLVAVWVKFTDESKAGHDA